MRVGLLIALALGTAATAGAQQQPAAQRPDSVEQVLLDVRIERAAGATVQAYRLRDQALIPVSQFLALAEVRHEVNPDGSIIGTLQPGDVAFTIDGTRDTALVGDRKFALRRTERLVRDGELYVDAEQLGPMFGVQFNVEWSDLLVSINDAESLPVAQRMRRQQARTVMLAQARQNARAAEGVPLGMLRPRMDGAVLDYTLTLPNRDLGCGTSAAGAFGANILGGSLELTGTAVGRDDGSGCRRTGDGHMSWTGVWLHNPWISQARVGEAITSGPSPRQIRGVLVSNSPYIREPEFGTASYTGFVGRGWEVEAYRAGGLVAVDTADTTGRFDIVFPIAYGDNPVEFFAYGPYGEERRFNQSYRVVHDLVPRKTLEYGLSAGVCPLRFMCRSTGNADVRYGLSATWTARAGLDRINRDSSGNLTHPYARLTGLFTNALSVDLRATYRALLGAEFAYQPSVNRRAALSYTVFDTGVESPLLTSSGMRSQLYLSGFYRPQRDQSRFFVQWNGEHTRRIASTFSSLEVVPSIQTRQVRYMPRLRIERAAPNTGSATTRSIGALSAFALLPPSWGSFWARMAASTNVELDLQSMQYTQANLSLITRLRGNRYLLSSSVSTSRGVPAIISLTLQTNLQALRGLTQSILQGGAPFTAIQTTQGSVVYNRLTNSTSFVAGPSLQRAGVTGTVFLDENSNGAYDVGEELLADVFVRAASGGATTDSLGRFEVWDIPTFTQTVVALDAGSLESPLWIPAVPAVTIEPGPNHYRPLSMAVVPGGSIDGIVVRKSGEIRLGLPGVRVTLTNTATREQQHQSTFADGGFSFLSVRPGRYVLTVDEHLMTRYAGTFSPVEVEVESLRDGALVEGVELAIETAPPPVPVIIDPLPQAPVDSDGDGVMDPDDRCPGTPAGVRVDVTGCALLFRAEERTVTLRGVNFRTGSAELTRESLGVLDSLAATLLALPDIRVEIGGHTDNTGSAALNQRLSLARARSVMQYLSSRGVPLSRMSAVGYGPRIPVAPNNTAEGRAQNRRVELRRIQ